MQKITPEQKEKAVQIAISGENPLPYLKECGSDNPAAIWYTIRQAVKDTNPELYAKIPYLNNQKKPQEPETPQPETKNDIEYEITGLRTSYGEFRISGNGYLFFGSNEKDEVEMPVELWQKFAKDLPQVMAILGVKL